MARKEIITCDICSKEVSKLLVSIDSVDICSQECMLKYIKILKSQIPKKCIYCGGNGGEHDYFSDYFECSYCHGSGVML